MIFYIVLLEVIKNFLTQITRSLSSDVPYKHEQHKINVDKLKSKTFLKHFLFAQKCFFNK